MIELIDCDEHHIVQALFGERPAAGGGFVGSIGGTGEVVSGTSEDMRAHKSSSTTSRPPSSRSTDASYQDAYGAEMRMLGYNDSESVPSMQSPVMEVARCARGSHCPCADEILFTLELLCILIRMRTRMHTMRVCVCVQINIRACVYRHMFAHVYSACMMTLGCLWLRIYQGDPRILELAEIVRRLDTLEIQQNIRL